VLFESFGIDLDDHIFAESDLNGRSDTGFADQRVAFSVYCRSNKKNSSHFHPISTRAAAEAILWLNRRIDIKIPRFRAGNDNLHFFHRFDQEFEQEGLDLAVEIHP
jgi:hypothetical protein